MKIRQLYCLAILLFASNSFIAQEENENVQISKFGVGINLTQVRISELYSMSNYFGVPANNFMVTVSPLKWLRIEPLIGFTSSTYADYNDKENKDKMFNVGTGLFGMLQRGNTNIYGGLRYENTKITNVSYQITDYTTNGPVYSKITAEASRNTFAPTLGAEYFLGKHFSFGGEFGLRIMSITSNSGQSGAQDQESKMSSTDASFQIRVYF